MANWKLAPGVAHLNHGSFGATPIEVLEEQDRWREAMERNPVLFMLETYQPALDLNRDQVASFVNAGPSGLVFVPNATYGINSVLRSLEPRIPKGAEILVTNHAYNACNNAAQISAERAGASLVFVDIPLPVSSSAEITAGVLDHVTPDTALVILDHVTSPTGLIMPVEEIIAALEPDIPVLIDGAHAPGMIPLDLAALGASFYTANCHKWMCAPKGSGFLHVANRHRDSVRAAAISHGLNDGWPGAASRFHAQFDWTGTDDPSARLSVGKAIEVMGRHNRNGWEGIRRENHDLVVSGRRLIADMVDSEPVAPDVMLGSTAAIRLPRAAKGSGNIFDPLMNRLRHEWKIEVPVFNWPDESQRMIRISAQQYNSIDEYQRLAEALRSELRVEV